MIELARRSYPKLRQRLAMINLMLLLPNRNVLRSLKIGSAFLCHLPVCPPSCEAPALGRSGLSSPTRRAAPPVSGGVRRDARGTHRTRDSFYYSDLE